MKKFLLTYIFSLIAVLGYSTQYEYNTSTPSIRTYDGSPMKVGQTFLVGSTSTNESFVIDSVSIYISMAINYNVYVEIYTLSGGLPTGSPISIGTIPLSRIPSSSSWVNCEVTSAALSASTSYALVFYSTEEYYDPPTYDLFNVGVTLSNNYTGGNMVSYSGGTWASDVVNQDLVFRIYGKHAPIITSQPASITRCVGTSATFSVVVDSDSPTYQWRKGGSNISGATSSSYTIASVVSGSAGNYDCVVTESLLGTTTTSSTATLTVPTTTSITSQPSSISRCVGTSATFSVTASGTSLTYQWKKDGSNISGATSTSYTISSVATGDAGNYTVTVTGTCGTVTSSAAVLTVNTAPSITDHPDNLSLCIGDNATFSVTATGSGLTYQWRKNSSNILGATSSTYSIPTVILTDEASYDVYVNGTCGSVTSNVALLDVITSSDCDLSSYWRFENNGIDAKGNYNLTANGATGYSSTYRIEGTYAGNCNVGGSNCFYTASDYNFGTAGLTINFAFKIDYTGTYYPVIFDTRVNGTGNGMYCFIDETNRVLYFRTHDGTTMGQISSASAAWTTGQWVYATITMMDTEGAYGKIFINGTQSGSDTTLQAGWDVTSPIVIGGKSTKKDAMFGYIDQFSIYKSRLSNARILDLYNNRTANYILDCGTAAPPASTGGKKILLAGKLRNIVLAGKERDFGGSSGEPTPEGGYYFSSVNGNDSYDGLTASTPKQSEAAMKALIPTLQPGDIVYFEKGSTWNDIDLNITVSGTVTDSIIFTSYGAGAKPIFTGLATLTTFSPSGNVWTKSDAKIKNTKENYLDRYNGSSQEYRRKTGFLGSIFINGTAYGLSRYPDSSPLTFESVDATGYTYVTDDSNPFTAGTLTGAQWKGLQGDWSMVYSTITSNTTGTLSITPGDFNSVFGNLDPGTTGMVMNSSHSSVLNQNGEYYHNTSGQAISIYWTSNLNSATVQIPAVDSVICLTGASYVKIDGLDIRGSRVNGIKIHGGGHNVISNCKVSYSGFNNIHLAGTSDNKITDNELLYADNGIYMAYADAVITYNYIHKIGLDPAYGDIEGYSGNGICSEVLADFTTIYRNYIDSVNYCGIHLHENTEGTSAGYLIKNNYIANFCFVRCDGGAIYCVSNDDNVDKSVLGNIVVRNSTVSSWIYSPKPIINSLYMDNYESYVDLDSNSVYGVSMFNHYGGDYMNFRNNKVVANLYTNYTNGGMHSEGLGSSDYLNFSYNEIVSTNNSTRLFTHLGANDVFTFAEGSTYTMDYNKYFSYNSGQNFFRYIEFWQTYQYYTTLAAWRTFTGKEAGSNLKFNSTLSSTEAVMYMNYSGSSHTFNLGSATFVDYDGVAKSGTLVVPAYRSTILYKTGGALDGDSPQYITLP